MSPVLRFTVLLMLFHASFASAQQLVFASIEEGRDILSNRDAYLSGMSSFDRSARMKTDRDVSLETFIRFSSSAVMEWETDEKESVQQAFRQIMPKIKQLSLPLPEKVLIVKTSGKEEGHAAYTRGNAIFIPRMMLETLTDEDLQGLLAHELFHVSTRYAPAVAERLYHVIGFEPCGELEYPAVLAPYKISNPDAPFNNSCIRLRLGQEEVRAMPLLLSRAEKYDVAEGGEFFNYLQVALLLVKPSADGKSSSALYDAGGPRLLGIGEVAGFFEQVGRNTEYIIHPEEILADNFSLLVMGVKGLPSPEVTNGIRRVLRPGIQAQQD